MIVDVIIYKSYALNAPKRCSIKTIDNLIIFLKTDKKHFVNNDIQYNFAEDKNLILIREIKHTPFYVSVIEMKLNDFFLNDPAI